MTNIEFIQAGKKITGFEYGYQKPFAVILRVSLRSVERYAAGELPPSPPVQKLIEELLKMINKPILVIFTEARPQYGDEEIKEIFDFSGVPDEKHTEMAKQLTQLASASSKGRCRYELRQAKTPIIK